LKIGPGVKDNKSAPRDLVLRSVGGRQKGGKRPKRGTKEEYLRKREELVKWTLLGMIEA